MKLIDIVNVDKFKKLLMENIDKLENANNSLVNSLEIISSIIKNGFINELYKLNYMDKDINSRITTDIKFMIDFTEEVKIKLMDMYNKLSDNNIKKE